MDKISERLPGHCRYATTKFIVEQQTSQKIVPDDDDAEIEPVPASGGDDVPELRSRS